MLVHKGPVDVRIEVRYAHSAYGSLSAQSREVVTSLLRIRIMDLLAASMAPLASGRYALIKIASVAHLPSSLRMQSHCQ